MSSQIKTPEEQIAYANLLFYGSWAGLALMAATYMIYLTGLLPPHVPVEKVVVMWSQKSSVYLHDGNVPLGWGWLGLLAKGDFLNFLGIALLAGMTIICYLPLIPAFFKKKEPIFAWIALAEVLVLCVAASGILGAGGH